MVAKIIEYPYTSTYIIGLIISYIYWGVNHGGEDKEVRVKHLLLGWFNHLNDDINSDEKILSLLVTSVGWPFSLACAIVAGTIFGIGWCFHQLFKKIRLYELFVKIMNIKI